MLLGVLGAGSVPSSPWHPELGLLWVLVLEFPAPSPAAAR